jgi:hypothetical protein
VWQAFLLAARLFCVVSFRVTSFAPDGKAAELYGCFVLSVLVSYHLRLTEKLLDRRYAATGIKTPQSGRAH